MASVSRLARMAAHVGHGVQRLATDAALQGMRRFPRRVEDLDAAVMSRILGRRVSSASVLDGTSGTSSRARLALAGDNVPESVFVKLPAAAAGTRMLGELARLGETEARFYKQLAPESATTRWHCSSRCSLTSTGRSTAGFLKSVAAEGNSVGCGRPRQIRAPR
jgi:hypothetical protein